MNLSLIVQLSISGLLLGGVYSLIAIGLSLIFGVMRVINFAHGEMMVWGMYVSYTLLTLTGIDPFLSFPISALVVFLCGYLLQRLIVNRILDFPEAMQVLPLVGMAMVFENSARLVWGPDYRSPQSHFALSSLSVGGIIIDVPRLLAFLLAVLITLAIVLFLKKTDLGKSIRAAADNRIGALLVGTKVNRTYSVCFGIGAACVGAAGGLLVPLMPLSPYIGSSFTLLSFVIVILGGMGSLPGAFFGGLLVGVAESLGTVIFPSSLKQVVSFSILIVIMLLKPQGLFGGKG